jgi:hypothetical protein
MNGPNMQEERMIHLRTECPTMMRQNALLLSHCCARTIRDSIPSGDKHVCFPEGIQTTGMIVTVGVVLQLNVAAYHTSTVTSTPSRIYY